MTADVDAVIAALQAVLDDAQRRTSEARWNIRAVNRWIDQLPGAWMGRWRHLKLDGESWTDVYRNDFIAHVKATLAYLEVNREAIRSERPWSWRFSNVRRPSPTEPIDAEFKDVRQTGKKRKPVRLIKSE